jgi:hypothetical protein
VYGLAAVDARGRVADHIIMRALGWRAGSRLAIRVSNGLILITVGEGRLGVTGQGHLRLPSAVRRGCGIEPGDRVLLVAEPSEGVLVVHPPATLDAIVSRFREAMIAGAA